MIDLGSQLHATLPERFQALANFAMLAIASFIMHYPDEEAIPREDETVADR
jgi:hypothetical protein